MPISPYVRPTTVNGLGSQWWLSLEPAWFNVKVLSVHHQITLSSNGREPFFSVRKEMLDKVDLYLKVNCKETAFAGTEYREHTGRTGAKAPDFDLVDLALEID